MSIDLLVSFCPFLSMAAIILEKDELHEESIKHYLRIKKELYDNKLELFHHAKQFENNEITPDTWCRGNGYALFSLVEILNFYRQIIGKEIYC